MVVPRGIVIDNKPASFNGYVRIKKYKIIIEEIKEPKKVLCKRLEKLWVESDNYHQYEPLERVAKELGYKFKNSFGSNKK